MHPQKPLPFHRNAGFTLVEFTIVLAIVGVITGAVLGIGRYITGEASKTKEALRQILTISSNVQTQYLAVPSGQEPSDWLVPANVTAGILTPYFYKLNLIPVEILSTLPGTDYTFVLNYHHAFGGVLWVVPGGLNNTAGRNFFTFFIKLFALSQTACISLMTQLPASDASLGIVSVRYGPLAYFVSSYNSTGPVWTTFDSTGGAIAGLAQTGPNAQAWCSQAGNANEVDIEFRLN